MERHTIDWFSLIAGLLFVGLGITYAVASGDDVVLDPRWVLAALLIGLGAAAIGAGFNRVGSPSPVSSDDTDDE